MKVAAVQAAPAYPIDKEASLDKVCTLVAEAGREGAKLVVLPETFVPAYPNWSIDLTNPQEWTRNLLQLTKNSVEVPGQDLDRVTEAARKAGTYVCLGMNERVPRYEGMLFNSLVFITPDGRIIGKHRKLTPSNRERCFWARGDGTTLRVYDTQVGRVGGLICYEHLQPLWKYMLGCQGEQIHCACWPGWPSFPNGRSNKSIIDVASRAYALENQCFVVLSSMYAAPELAAKAKLGNASWTFFGGSGIINPEGEYIAGPVYDRETIVYGEIDLEHIVLRKAAVDVSGKDNRWDIMRVETNAQPCVPFTGTFGTRLWEEMQVEGTPPADDRDVEMPEILARLAELERKTGLSRENPAGGSD
jgi:nitrilase